MVQGEPWGLHGINVIIIFQCKKKRTPPKVRHDSHEMVVNVDNQPKTLEFTTAVKYPDVSII